MLKLLFQDTSRKKITRNDVDITSLNNFTAVQTNSFNMKANYLNAGLYEEVDFTA